MSNGSVVGPPNGVLIITTERNTSGRISAQVFATALTVGYGPARPLGNFEFHRAAGLPLADAGPIGRIAAWRDVLDFQGDHVATTKFTVDSDVEQRQIAGSTFKLEL